MNEDGKATDGPSHEMRTEADVGRRIQALDEEWSAAIVSNDAEAIGRYMSDDWVIVSPDGTVIDRARFLAVIESGVLRHSSMRSEDWRVRVYGNTAVVTAETWSEAEYMGQASSTHERSTSVFLQQDGRWKCVLTHLTPIAGQ